MQTGDKLIAPFADGVAHESIQRPAFPEGNYPMDNGPELISQALAQWAEEHGVILEFIRLEKTIQNAFTERFNRTFRKEILDFTCSER